MHLNDSLGQCPDIEYVCNLHEQAAAIAAEAYTRVTNHLGVAMADNNSRLWGTAIEGIPVFSPQEAAQRFGESAAFLISIWSEGADRQIPLLRRQLSALGCRTILSFVHLFRKHPDLFPRRFGSPAGGRGVRRLRGTRRPGRSTRVIAAHRPVLAICAYHKQSDLWRIPQAIKSQSKEHSIIFAIRRAYYNLVSRLSEIALTNNFCGFGLFDRVVIEAIREMDDPYPYGRGMISEIGFQPVKIEYTQNQRERGITKSNFYALYDMVMLGITSHSKVPLRLATMSGFAMAGLSGHRMPDRR